MKYLVIDNTMTMPIRGVVDKCGDHVGTTQMLHDNEVKDYARWIGQYGGRELLDAFEVQLINDGMLMVWPVDADGDPLHDECYAVEIRRYDDGSRIVWQAKAQCQWCHGEGHHNQPGEAVAEEDLCMACCGDGYGMGPEFETDMDGVEIQAPAAQGDAL